MVLQKNWTRVFCKISLTLILALRKTLLPLLRPIPNRHHLLPVEPMLELVVRNKYPSVIPFSCWIPFSILRHRNKLIKTRSSMRRIFVITIVLIINDLILAPQGPSLHICSPVFHSAIAIRRDIELKFKFKIRVMLLGPNLAASPLLRISIKTKHSLLKRPSVPYFPRRFLSLTWTRLPALKTITFEKIDPLLLQLLSINLIDTDS